MSRIATILPLEHVLIDIEATSKKRVFEEAGLLLEQLRKLSRALITESLLARERLGSTSLGNGVAIPHGRIPNLKNPTMAIVRLANPIRFDAADTHDVSLLIFLLVPEAATQRHLEILAEIAEMLSSDTLRQSLMQAPTAAALHQIVMEWRPAPQDT